MKEPPYAPCGLFCGACGATDCGGCLSDRIDDSIRTCKFRNCSQEKGVEFCRHCADYPCEPLHEFMTDKWPHHWTMESNLECIKNHGAQKWIEAQRSEWSCTSCGAEIVWYQKSCECGQPLGAFEVPE